MRYVRAGVALVFLLALVLCAAPGGFVRAASPLEELEQQLTALNEQLATAQLAGDARTVQRVHAARRDNLAAQIGAVNEDIAAAQAALRTEEDGRAANVLALQQARAEVGERLRAMYLAHEAGGSLAAVLGAKSWGELLRYGENASRLTAADAAAMEALRSRQAALAAQDAQLETQMALVVNQNAVLADKSAQYAACLCDAEGLSMEEAAARADALAYAARREKAAAAEAEWQTWLSGETTPHLIFGGGRFAWPLKTRWRLSSEWNEERGLRSSTKAHRGIDIPAPHGTPVYAAASGTVSTEAHWSYGICVRLDHGDNLFTMYGHLSARAVEDGAWVDAGQLIGYVGSTGNSTGNHLHFEVDVGEEPADPFLYVNGG